ncbi:MAG: 50S ribosomal protein L4 [Acidobacteriota bacterium]|nr:MAG: 50S ribosomal protein L4 [Acidobacteriota bacterium]
MLEVVVKDVENQSVGRVALDEAIFSASVNEGLIEEDVRHQLAMRRAGTASTKTRAEARGGGRKPWRQKGTGRARHGSRRSPLWRGGGVTFGPKPRDYGYRLPKKKRWGALCSALTQKVQDDALAVVERLELERPKAKDLLGVLANLGLGERKVLIVDEENHECLALSARNVVSVDVARPMALRSVHVLHADAVLFTRQALLALTEGMPR